MATTNNLSGVMSLTPEQYNTLVTEGEITVGGVTYEYDEGTMYLVKPEELTLGKGLVLDEESGVLSANVAGVQVGGNDLTPDSNGKVNVPISSSSSFGVVKVTDPNGIKIASTGHLLINSASDAEIVAKTDTKKPIVPANLQLAVDTGVKGSTNYTTFSCEMADGTTKQLKIFCELL